MRNPRVLFVARTRYSLPLAPGLRQKFVALANVMDVRVLASAGDGRTEGDAMFRLVPRIRPRRLDGLAFWLLLPFRVIRELRSFRPDAVVAQTAHEGAAVLVARRLARSPARLVLEVHADWRAPTRLYGAAGRRFLGPLADRIAAVALRRADAVRTISGYTAGLVRELGIEPAGSFPAFMDLGPFVDRAPEPLPERARALFVGVLERYKNVDGLADAWRLATPRVPDATLQIVGRGSRADVVEQLLRDAPGCTEWTPWLGAGDVARALDSATLLVLPSRSEGMGRVIVEAFCRGRPVVGSRVGGIPDLVEDGVNGLLVEPGDTAGLAAALERLLTDRQLAAKLAEGAHRSAETWLQSPDLFAERMGELVASATRSGRPQISNGSD